MQHRKHCCSSEGFTKEIALLECIYITVVFPITSPSQVVFHESGFRKLRLS